VVVAELGQPVQAAIEFTAVLVEERLELGTGWLIDDILSGRRWKGGHKRSISGTPPTGKVPLIGMVGPGHRFQLVAAQAMKTFRRCQSRYFTPGAWAPSGRSSTSRNGGRP